MQGKVTFTIKDAKSGIIKHKYTQHNMVTKAVERVFSANLRRGLKNTSIDYRDSAIPLIQDVMGGIMIFDENLNTSHICPDVKESMHMIGCANDNANPDADGIKGKLVSADIQKDKAIYQWEFGENTCDGDIKAVALTSRVGGELGCKINSRIQNRIANTFLTWRDGSTSITNNYLINMAFDIFSVAGVYLLDGTNLIKYDTGSRSGGNKKFTIDLSYDYTRDIRPDFTANYSIETPYTEDSISSISGYYPIVGPLSTYAYMGYCTASEDENPVYKLHLKKYTAAGDEDIEVPMNNLISAVKNRYNAAGLIDADSPDSRTEILNCLNSALQNGICTTWGEKLFWFVGRYGTQEAEGDFLSIYIQEEDGSFTSIDVESEDSIFYSLIDRNGGQNVELYGLLYNKNLTANNKFEISVIDGELYLVANDYYFFFNIDPQSTFNLQIYNRPSMYIPNGVSYFRRMSVDSLSASPYYEVFGKSYYNDYDPIARCCISCNILRMNYFATIQNLQIPFPKGASESMTVTYELSSQSS